MGFLGNLFRSAPRATPGHHDTLDLPQLAERVQRLVNDRIAILEATPSYAALRSVHFTLKAHAAVQAAVAPGGRAWSRALWSGAMACEGLLACARPSEFEVYFNREITVPPAPEPAPGLAGIWREGLEMAVLARYDEVASALQRFDIKWLRQRDATTCEAELLYGHVLHGWFSRAPDLGDRMVAAAEAIARPDASDFVLRLLGAELECLYAIETGDRAKLHAALASGLEQHRGYWTRAERATNPEGFFALGLSFVARLAATRGMAVDLRSPYLVYGESAAPA
jgi:hypothetical protein